VSHFLVIFGPPKNHHFGCPNFPKIALLENAKSIFHKTRHKKHTFGHKKLHKTRHDKNALHATRHDFFVFFGVPQNTA
jgi:hypothetical protein